ncbi:MAG: hypothetical protein K6V97_14870 [Actinomycetia bacterium]|nr:hypothetical protein [Actinomycetes bacterium]
MAAGARWGGTALAVGLLLAAAGCGGAGLGSSPAHTTTRASSRWMTYDTRTKTAYLTVIAGYNGTRDGFNFDGYADGRLVFRVPVGWDVTIRFVNRGTTPHSVVITRGHGRRPAFPGAAVPETERISGLAPGQSTIFTFRPTRVGSYRLVCLVPGHEDRGMWDRFVVTAGGMPSTSP